MANAPLNFAELSAAPTDNVQTNDIYLDDGTNTASGNPGFRRYTGSAWEDISAGAGSSAVSADTLVLNDGSELTIATGAITVTHARHSVDTEADAASDDLATVNGLAANEACIITANNTARTVVVKHGTDNITSVTGSDITIDDDVKAVCLLGNIAGTGVNAYPLFDEVTPSSTTTFTNKTITDLKLTDATELTIATGAVTVTQSYHSIDTESDAASDDLDTINGGVAGDVLYIFANNDARTVVVKNGTGNILTYDGNDISLDEDHKVIELLFNGTNWRVVGVVGGGSGSTLSGFSVGKTDVGSALAAGAWRKLECVEVADPDTLISVASSVITFAQSGLYALVDVWIRFATVSTSQVTFRLRNTTASTNAVEGTSAIVNTTYRTNIGLSGIFAVTASDTFELQIFPDDQNATQEAPDTFTNAPGFTPFAFKATFIRLQ